MAIEDFEWEGELEVSEARGPARPPPAESWLTRWRKSVWLAPALRLGGMALLLGVLAGIGVVATTYAKPGRPLPDGSRALVDALGTGWLKPTPAPPDVRSSAPAAVAAPASSSAAQPPTAAPSAAPPAAGGAPVAGVTTDGKVILNLASAEELTRLPGVGAKRAEAIVALRGKLKRFRQLTDLLRVKGIGPRGLKRMLPHLVLDAPS
ncbi:MAG TPA: helix-hairpin-helix domain-containing protein [Polyangiaceae bacterium]